ncbi:hypothetical protein [Leptolyngbya sp. FACHB-17]|uniref:hypothetical protein n=1 Tax=unclassified Leptolyngbya TaxID=2650499 RepID=UPI001681AE0F|nr:hypothetical protein [Leptolyngbya sp. FACHB-17]MBD2083026.1 hypothetical protein [Leptolyngbya sp. FACHB-17]
MPYAVLDQSVRQNLEQERDRLTNDREAIIKEAVAAATSEIDKTLEYLNGLLGGEIAPSTNGKKIEIEVPAIAEVAEAKPKRKGRGKAKATEETTVAPEKKTRGKKSEDAPKQKRNVKPPVPFDATMKRDFKGMTPAEAVYKVMSGSPSDTYTTDEMIEVLYGSLPSVNMPEARKRIALMMAHGMRKGTYEKVGENPSRFKIAG